MERPAIRKKISNNIVIAIAVVSILLIALIAGVILGSSAYQPGNSPTSTPPTASSTASSSTEIPTTISPTLSPSIVPFDFNMSVFGNMSVTPTFNLIQGGNLTTTVILTTISGNIRGVNPSDVVLSADSGSSGIHCDFGSPSLEYPGMTGLFPNTRAAATPSGFSSQLNITAPDSTPTNKYTVTITAKIGTVSHSTPVLVAVAGSSVTVSGTVNGNTGITPIQIQFHDMTSAAGEYTATLTNASYSISIPNNRVYFVSVNDGTGLNGKGPWHNVDTFFTVEVPAGSTSLTHDFTVGP